MTGAILIASGRVPKTVSILSIARDLSQFQAIGVEEILDRPADLGAGDVLGPFAVAAVEAAGLVLDRLEIRKSAVGSVALAHPIPHKRILCDARRAHPANVRISRNRAVLA